MLHQRSDALLLALLATPAAAAPAPPAPAKISPWVLDRTERGAVAEFTVVLKEQADLSETARLRTKAEKGRLVHDTLLRTALRCQTGLLSELKARGVEHRTFHIVNLVWVKGDRELALALAARADVLRVDGNPSVRNDLPRRQEERAPAPGPTAVEPGVAYVRAPEVWATGVTGQGIVVGGMDTGVRWTHTALKPRYRGWNGTTADHDYSWHDAIHTSSGSCGANAVQPCDDYGHGSHTLGTVLGDDGGTNQVGVAPGAKWIGCRNMDGGNGTPTTYLECLEWMLAPYPVGGTPAQGDPTRAPDVTVNSWSCPASEGCDSGNWETLRAAFEAHRTAGILPVASAGNNGPGCSTVNVPPAMFDESFSSGAFSSATGTIAAFSSRGPVTADGSDRPKPDVSAPGVSIRSATSSGDTSFSTMSGTSMAAPHVAGVAALVLSAVPALAGNVAALETRISQAAVPVPLTNTCSSDGSPNNVYGAGRLDALCAVHGNLSAVSAGVVGSTTIGTPCTGGTASVTDTGGGTGAHQWGYRTVPGDPITNLAGQTGTSYVLTCTDFPAPGVYYLVVTTTPQCGAATTSNEIAVTVSATPVELQMLRVE